MYQIEANDPGIVKASEVKDLSGDLHKEFLKIFKFLFIFFQQQEHLLRLGNTIKMCESLAWMMEEKERTRVFATIKHPYWVCWVCLHQHRLLSFVLIQVSQGWESFAEIVHCQTFSASCFEFVFPQKCSDFQTVACFRERKKKKKEELSSHVNYFYFRAAASYHVCILLNTTSQSYYLCNLDLTREVGVPVYQQKAMRGFTRPLPAHWGAGNGWTRRDNIGSSSGMY